MAESVAPKTSAGSSTSEDGADIVGGTEVVDGKAARDLSSTDIFEIAAELSSECANIGNRYGQDTVAKIVPCVVRVLEELEFAVEKAELLTADLVEAQHDAKLAKEEQQREVTYRRRIESVRALLCVVDAELPNSVLVVVAWLTDSVCKNNKFTMILAINDKSYTTGVSGGVEAKRI